MFKKDLSYYSPLTGLILGINSNLRQHTISNGAADYIMSCAYPEIRWTIYKGIDGDFRVGFHDEEDDVKIHDAYNEINNFIENN